jgi:hypothetical protein
VRVVTDVADRRQRVGDLGERVENIVIICPIYPPISLFSLPPINFDRNSRIEIIPIYI